jgi:hypothetical protein
MQSKLRLSSVVLLGVWLLAVYASKDPNNPPPGKTGAPGETTCSQNGCHSGGNFTGTVSISGIPDTVVPNQSYTITLTNESNASRAGFEMTCLDAALVMSGTFTAPAGSGVSIGSGAAGRKYPRQSSPKNISSGVASWSFTWTAPASAAENKATFYFVSLCANGNGQKSGDNVLQATKTVVLQTPTSSVDEHPTVEVKLYPTVLEGGMLFIDAPSHLSGILSIYNASGQRVFEQPVFGNTSVPLDQLKKGWYLAQVTLGERVFTQKIMVN